MNHAPTLADRIARLFSSAMNLEVPSVETDLFETGILDSLAFVDLLLHLERTFGVTTSLEDLEIEHFRSIARIAEFVMNRTTAVSAMAAEPRIAGMGTGA